MVRAAGDGLPAQGTVNALFRLGERAVARFPLQPGDVSEVRSWLRREAEAARQLVGRSRFLTPRPIAIGDPGLGYPLPWSVQTWLPGTVASPDHPADSVAFAHDLAAFITDVRAIDTGGRTFSGTGTVGAATCPTTTHGWQPVFRAAKTCSTSPHCAGCGLRCVNCLRLRAAM